MQIADREMDITILFGEGAIAMKVQEILGIRCQRSLKVTELSEEIELK